MTEDFIYRMNLAIEKGYNDAKKENMEFLKKVKSNQQYANLYIELVLAFIEQFDFNTGEFKTENISKKIIKNFGYPKNIKAYISSEENNIGTIAFDYYDGFECFLHADQPEFKNDESFDLNIVNDLLQKYDISVVEQHIDEGGKRYHEDCISFDASLLIEARKELLKEVQEAYNELIMNLGINNNQKFSFNQEEIRLFKNSNYKLDRFNSDKIIESFNKKSEELKNSNELGIYLDQYVEPTYFFYKSFYAYWKIKILSLINVSNINIDDIDEITKKLGITKEEYFRPNKQVYEKAKKHISRSEKTSSKLK